MPRSAITTGMVDLVLPPGDMPAQLIAYVRHAFDPARKPPPPLVRDGLLRKLCVLLRAQTGHDFSQYKETTLLRRMERRMALHQLEQPEDYLRHCRDDPAELDALFRDLLIGVTSFFRDPEAFKVLEEKLIPASAGRKVGARAGARVGVRLLHRRGGVFDRHPAARAHDERQARVQAAGVCHRHRPPGDRTRARGHLSRQHRRQHERGAAGALLHPRSAARHLPHPEAHP